eukprot:2079548-Rhodomonas_salina.1
MQTPILTWAITCCQVDPSRLAPIGVGRIPWVDVHHRARFNEVVPGLLPSQRSSQCSSYSSNPAVLPGDFCE